MKTLDWEDVLKIPHIEKHVPCSILNFRGGCIRCCVYHFGKKEGLLNTETMPGCIDVVEYYKRKRFERMKEILK